MLSWLSEAKKKSRKSFFYFFFFFYHFFVCLFVCNITEYDCAKFHVKSIFLSGFTQGEYYVLQLPPSLHPKAWSDENTPGQIELKTSSPWYPGWLGQHRPCCNTNKRLSFLTLGLAFKTLARAFQTLSRTFDFLLRLQKLGRVFGNSAECLKSTTKHFKVLALSFNTSNRSSVSLKRVKHCIFIAVYFWSTTLAAIP